MKMPFLFSKAEPESAIRELTATQTERVGGGLNEECFRETVANDGSRDVEFND